MLLEKFELLKENTSDATRKRRFFGSFLDTEQKSFSSPASTKKILMDIVDRKPTNKIIEQVVNFAKDYVGFESCAVYEWMEGNKLKLLYTDIPYEPLLKFKQKQIFANKKSFFRTDDIFPEEDENALYHPVVIGNNLQYIFIFDEVDEEEHDKNIKMYSQFCKELLLVMGCLMNRTVANRSKYMDHLTGLPNELQLRKDIQYCIDSKKDYILAIVEINDIGEYNATYGVELGDKLIKKTAIVLNDYAQRGDGVYRYFGARLAILLCGTQEKHFKTLEDLQCAINQQPVEYHGQEISFLCTIGAVEIKYMEESLVDVAYKKVFKALKVDRGGICFSGERREIEFKEEVEEKEHREDVGEEVPEKKDEQDSPKNEKTEDRTLQNKEEDADNVSMEEKADEDESIVNDTNDTIEGTMPVQEAYCELEQKVEREDDCDSSVDEKDCEQERKRGEDEVKPVPTDETTGEMSDYAHEEWEYSDADVLAVTGEDTPFYPEDMSDWGTMNEDVEDANSNEPLTEEKEKEYLSEEQYEENDDNVIEDMPVEEDGCREGNESLSSEQGEAITQNVSDVPVDVEDVSTENVDMEEGMEEEVSFSIDATMLVVPAGMEDVAGELTEEPVNENKNNAVDEFIKDLPENSAIAERMRKMNGKNKKSKMKKAADDEEMTSKDTSTKETTRCIMGMFESFKADNVRAGAQ